MVVSEICSLQIRKCFSNPKIFYSDPKIYYPNPNNVFQIRKSFSNPKMFFKSEKRFQIGKCHNTTADQWGKRIEQSTP